ncbi:MAG: ribose 5-phosphate isomerase B [Lachnospira sp.]|jgi:ribose 5-phosphate isomerase B|nr:ribose 5-phosphate isomerase B [Lachnospira sp.]
MIAIGCDHGALDLKNQLKEHLDKKGVVYKDFGCNTNESCDYPIYAHKVTDAVLSGECELGILLCGTGIGMSIAANKVKGIRAALCGDCFSAQVTREHNDSNVLCIGARVVGSELALRIVDTFLGAEFSQSERHKRRIAMLEEEE